MNALFKIWLTALVLTATAVHASSDPSLDENGDTPAEQTDAGIDQAPVDQGDLVDGAADANLPPAKKNCGCRVTHRRTVVQTAAVPRLQIGIRFGGGNNFGPRPVLVRRAAGPVIVGNNGGWNNGQDGWGGNNGGWNGNGNSLGNLDSMSAMLSSLFGGNQGGWNGNNGGWNGNQGGWAGNQGGWNGNQGLTALNGPLFAAPGSGGWNSGGWNSNTQGSGAPAIVGFNQGYQVTPMNYQQTTGAVAPGTCLANCGARTSQSYIFNGNQQTLGVGNGSAPAIAPYGIL